MAAPDFKYQEPLPIGKDETEYYLLTKDYVSVSQFEGKEILKVEKDGLTLLAKTAMHDCSFMLRTDHIKQIAEVLHDSNASKNDKFVSLVMLKNAEVSAKEYFLSARIQEQRQFMLKRVVGFGLLEVMMRRSHSVFTKPILAIIFDTLKLSHWICTRRKIQEQIFPLKLIYTQPMVPNISFYS